MSSKIHFVNHTLTRIVQSRWLVIAAGIWIQSVAGFPYDFSVYSQSIKSNLHYNQQDLDTISFFKGIGANVGIVAGLLYDASTPSITLALAAGENLLGYLMMWLSIAGKIPRPPVWNMCLYMCVAANAETFMNTAVVVTCVKIFPNNRGTVVGLMKGFLGLSGAMLVQLYHAIYADNQTSFVLLISWLIPVVCVAFMFVIRPLPEFEDGHEKFWFNRLSLMAMVLAAYLLVLAIFQSIVSLGRAWSIATCVSIFLVLLFPLWVTLKAELQTEESRMALSHALLEERVSNKKLLCSTSYSDNVEVDQLATSNDGRVTPNHERVHDLSLLEAVQTVDFWLLFYTTACAMGSGITTIDNMSQLGSSLHYTQREVATLVSLWSIWSFLGRFGGGYTSEHYLHEKGVARPLFIAITLTAMGIGHIMIGAAFPASLYLGSTLVGIGYGAQWSLMPATTSEIFGLQHFGTLFNTITVASPLAAYILSVKLAGQLYDLEAEKEQHQNRMPVNFLESDNLTCNGPHCFRLTSFIMAVVCCSGLVAALWLYLRTRLFYKHQIYQKLHHNGR